MGNSHPILDYINQEIINQDIRDEGDQWSVEGAHYILLNNNRKIELLSALFKVNVVDDKSYNDSVDGFKHAYTHAKYASVYGYKYGYEFGYDVSSVIGYYHETETYIPNQAHQDMYNNEVGRRVGIQSLHIILSNPQNANKSEAEIEMLTDNLIKKTLYKKLLDGELVTDPFVDPDPKQARHNHRVDDLFKFNNFTLRDNQGNELFKTNLLFPIRTGRYDRDYLSFSESAFKNNWYGKMQDLLFTEEGKEKIILLETFSKFIFHYIINHQIDRIKDIFNLGKKTISPLILDLDGDGVETLSINNGTYFDHNADGFSELTGWASPDDGLLVLDINDNGLIDSGRELFGEHTLLSNGEEASGGFEALAELDSNLDGKIDANDTQFSDLKIWIDANSDGITDSGELHTLGELNIESISLNFENVNKEDAEGNLISQAGSYTTTDQVTHDLSDIKFQVNNVFSQAVETLEISPEVEALPKLKAA